MYSDLEGPSEGRSIPFVVLEKEIPTSVNNSIWEKVMGIIILVISSSSWEIIA